MKWRPLGPAIVGFACAWLFACSVGPAYRRPDVAPPAEWRESAGHGGLNGDEAPPSVWPAADWWHGFGSEQLDDLIAEAERNNDDLAGAVARVREADAQVRIAGAALLPFLDAGASATRQRTQVSGAGPRVSNLFIPQLSASYELDFWGKNRALLYAALITPSPPTISARHRQPL
jgi:outer membrane protein TolC